MDLGRPGAVDTIGFERRPNIAQAGTTLTWKWPVAHRVLDRVLSPLGLGVTHLNGEDMFVRNRGDVEQRSTASGEVPRVEKQARSVATDGFRDPFSATATGHSTEGRELKEQPQTMPSRYSIVPELRKTLRRPA
jgi:hypothetical protein